jgi:hypothetical protein
MYKYISKMSMRTMVARRMFPESAVINGIGRRRMKGGGFMDFLRSAGRFLKRTKLLSRVGGLASMAFPVLKGPAAVAGMLGYGRRHRRRGGRRCR